MREYLWCTVEFLSQCNGTLKLVYQHILSQKYRQKVVTLHQMKTWMSNRLRKQNYTNDADCTVCTVELHCTE